MLQRIPFQKLSFSSRGNLYIVFENETFKSKLNPIALTKKYTEKK